MQLWGSPVAGFENRARRRGRGPCRSRNGAPSMAQKRSLGATNGTPKKRKKSDKKMSMGGAPVTKKKEPFGGGSIK